MSDKRQVRFYVLYGAFSCNMKYDIQCCLSSCFHLTTCSNFSSLFNYILTPWGREKSLDRKGGKTLPPLIFLVKKKTFLKKFSVIKWKRSATKKRRVLTCQTGKRLVYLCLVRIFIIVIVWEGITQASNLKENGCINIIFKSFLLTTHDHKTKPACIRK